MLVDIYKFNLSLLRFGYQISRALPVGGGEENNIYAQSVGYKTKCVTVFVNIVIRFNSIFNVEFLLKITSWHKIPFSYCLWRLDKILPFGF